MVHLKLMENPWNTHGISLQQFGRHPAWGGDIDGVMCSNQFLSSNSNFYHLSSNFQPFIIICDLLFFLFLTQLCHSNN